MRVRLVVVLMVRMVPVVVVRVLVAARPVVMAGFAAVMPMPAADNSSGAACLGRLPPEKNGHGSSEGQRSQFPHQPAPGAGRRERARQGIESNWIHGQPSSSYALGRWRPAAGQAVAIDRSSGAGSVAAL
jgi:hypothetical protein